MFYETSSFFLIATLILLSFATGMYNIYHPYANNIRTNPDGSQRIQSNHYISLVASVSHLYWSFFGYSDTETPEIILPEVKVQIGNETVNVYNEHQVTENFGYILYAAFHLMGVVVLINIFIAILANVYSAVVRKGRRGVEVRSDKGLYSRFLQFSTHAVMYLR